MPNDPRTDHRALTLGLFAGVFATAFEAIAVATVMPTVATDLNGVAWYAWSFSLFMAGSLLGNITAGRVADRAGPTPALYAGLLVFTAGLLVAGLAPVMTVLLLGRFVQGLGSGSFNVAMYVVVARAYEGPQRAVMMTWISAAWVVPGFVGPPIAAAVSGTWSWHWVFLGIVPLVVIAAVLITPALIRLTREGALGVEEGATPVAVWIGLVLVASVIALQYAGQRLGVALTVPAVLAAIAGAGGLVAALTRMMPTGFWRVAAGIPAVIWSRALFAGAFFGAESFIPLMLQRQGDLTPLQAGIILTVGSIGWFVGSWLQARTWVPLTRNQLITVGAAAIVVAIGLVAAQAAFDWWPWLAALAWTCGGFGMGLATASTGLAVMTLSPTAQQGRNNASLQSAEALGTSLVTALAGTLFAWALPRLAIGPMFALTLAALCLVALAAVAASLRIGVVRD
ncbi:MFS transporter [Granulicoccus phenolivorans]|uniref:MFS transporter n=1 Tax=Granulicoccus phenolivorans TaxID=266854 RepID=UPI0003F73D7E|nr:MFS transporter [Granulicoccus phenolivorans]